MRPQSIVLLIAAALLACVDGASAATASKSTTAAFPGMSHSFADNQDIISTKRSLRTSKEPSEDDEERSGTDKITGLVKPGAAKLIENAIFKSWLRKDNIDPTLVWKKLGLEEVSKAKALSELKDPENEAFFKNVVVALLVNNKGSVEKTAKKLAENNKKAVEEAVKRLEAGL